MKSTIWWKGVVALCVVIPVVLWLLVRTSNMPDFDQVAGHFSRYWKEDPDLENLRTNGIVSGNFSRNWKEDPKLKHLRTYGIVSGKFSRNWKEDPELKHLRTYGIVENIPDIKVLNTYNAKRLSAIFHSFLDNGDFKCHRKLRMGKVGDGGWEVCDDYEWRPIPPCVIYSFGIDNDFSFDDDAGRIYGCDVYSFDPSMKQATHQRSPRVAFYRLGIGAKTEKLSNGWVLHSLSDLRALLNHTDTVIDVLKMDVEHAEWLSLPNMIKEGQLRNVRQLLMEYHHIKDDVTLLRSRLKVIGDVEREGFRKFYTHKNQFNGRKALGIPITRDSAYEIHYVNGNFRRK